MHRSISAALTMALALALFVAACGEERVVASDTTAGETLPVDAIELRLAMGSAGADAIDEAVDVVRARLDSLGIAASSVEATPDGMNVRVAPADEELVRKALQIPGVLEFRPVLATPGPEQGQEPITSPEERAADGEVVLSDEEGSMYRLGPVALDGRSVERATVSVRRGTWSVAPTLRTGADGIDRFNAITSACYDGTPTCPRSAGNAGLDGGQLAIVLDGLVLSAPSINTPRFERDQIEISGSFDETSARALAAALDAGGAPATWSLPD